MKTSIIIATFNKIEYTKQCIESIRAYTKYQEHEIIVVDNHSTDGTVEWLNQQEDIRSIFNNENRGFPAACNQGIELADKRSHILLLNNDTVVTANWLSNMLKCLFSQEDIGAVGTLTNNCSNNQKVEVFYESIDEMQTFANSFNQSNPLKWEERIRLVGYSLLIKRSVINQIGHLDERFTPGNFEDDDYSLRIRLAGYRLMLCKDTFIHHYGSTTFNDEASKYLKLLATNRERFREKWGFDPVLHGETEWILLDWLEEGYEQTSDPIHFLHIGCGTGGSLLQKKSQNPGSTLFGYEVNPKASAIASLIADVQSGSIMNSIQGYPDAYFDRILLTETNELEQVLQQIRRVLKPTGILVAKVPNISHVTVIRKQLEGCLPGGRMSYYSKNQLLQYLNQAGFQNYDATNFVVSLSSQDNHYLHYMKEMGPKEQHPYYDIQSFGIKAGQISRIEELLQEIASDRNLDENLNKLLKWDAEVVAETVAASFLNNVEVLQKIGCCYFERGKNESVLPFFNKALALDSTNPDTLFNIAYFLYNLGEYRIALEWLQKRKRDEISLKLEYEIMSVLKSSPGIADPIKYLLRRVEHHIEPESTKKMLIEQLAEERDLYRLTEYAHSACLYPDRVLNEVARCCFENGLYSFVLPLYEKSLESNPQNKDTLFNIGLLLHSVGEREGALYYLDLIEEKDDATITLIQTIEGERYESK